MFGRVYKNVPMRDFYAKDSNGNPIADAKTYSIRLAVRFINPYTKEADENFINEGKEKNYRPLNYKITEELYNKLRNGSCYHFTVIEDIYHNSKILTGLMSDQEAKAEDEAFKLALSNI